MKAKYGMILLILLSICLCGCSEKVKEEQTQEEHEEISAIQIGITFDSFVIERWQRDRDVFVSTAKELGADVIVQNANGDVEEQKSQIQYFINKKVDVIVIVAVDSESLSDEVEKAHKAGIKVIGYDRLLLNAQEDLYISFDNEAVGTLMAETIIQGMPSGGKIIKINGPTKDYNVYLVNQGFNKAMEDANIEVIGSMNASEWKGEEAFNYLNENTSKLFQAGAIMCGNDCLAGQTIRALSERRLAGKVIVVGQDADLDACQRIVEGTQTMTVYKPIEKLAKQAAECAVSLAQGKEFETEKISDGKHEIPYVKIEPIKVTKDNIDFVIINTGFHLKEDVYANVPY
ncbi:MAG: substrate-binding domain-containing protein [Lachnospiraceae bacterium]|nr:substrate-binding domain-containing protein [Lachnospiraceae bacterium]